MAPTIVLVHGLYLTPRSWDGWIDRFQQKGYQVLAPAWPGLEVEVEQLRNDPSPIARLNVAEIVDHYDAIIRGLDSPPIIMGHSFGGAFTQMLVDRGLGTAAVAIESGTLHGVRDLPYSTLKSSFPLLRNPFLRHKAIMLTPEQFNYGFTNTFPAGEAAMAYERYAIPGSRNVLLEGAFSNLNPKTAMRVDFKKSDRAPMLFIAGGEDHVIPLPVNKHNVEKYKDSKAITEYKEYPGRAHFTMKQEGWEEIADYALSWATEHAAVYLDGQGMTSMAAGAKADPAASGVKG
jgi:pimeloyl-ACP methyl ester carboxylesterase